MATITNKKSLFNTSSSLSFSQYLKKKNHIASNLSKIDSFYSFPSKAIKTWTHRRSTNYTHAPYLQSVVQNRFPSLVIGRKGSITPQGSFAEIQAQFLTPDKDVVHALKEKLHEANMGIVAHYYMDVELQGVLTAIEQLQQEENQTSQVLENKKQNYKDGSILSSSKRRIAIADSLAMGEYAVQMCKDHVQAIVCLGVDFMSESVAAIMARNGYGHIPVYRATTRSIGCSLAESAERATYRAWLEKHVRESKEKQCPVLHVIYINTSMDTKAMSSSILPTITCTSSNVLATILEASADVPTLNILYGPDTYMGNNLIAMFDSILTNVEQWDDTRIARDLHPRHTRDSIQQLRNNIHVYPHGNCVVHHMFGQEVVRVTKSQYADAFVTAHLEVPGEMFQIALEKSFHGKGVVGSTSDILRFITNQVQQQVIQKEDSGQTRRLKFILGTEAGMITSIVKSVSDILDHSTNEDKNIEVEIIFPVSSEAVMSVDDNSTPLVVVPGVSGGEGCSTAGGCATCPFMKMNNLDSLSDIVDLVLSSNQESKLRAHLPPDRLRGKIINGVNAVELGSESILFMRQLMKEKRMPQELLHKIKSLS